MRVVVYEPWYDAGHRATLRAFAKGCGGEVRDVRSYTPCDVAVIFGGYKKSYAKTKSKADIMAAHAGKPLIILEMGFVRRGEYFAVGLGGINGNADFGNANSPSYRWDALRVRMRPWHARPGYALVMGQVPWDVSVQDTDHCEWCRSTVSRLQNSGRLVLFRPHPLAVKRGVDYGVPRDLVSNRDLDTDLAGARQVITWNSNSGVDAVIAGVPTVTMDRGSMAWPVSSHDDTVTLRPERMQWAYNLAYAQWSIQEMVCGDAWDHIRRRIHDLVV